MRGKKEYSTKCGFVAVVGEPNAGKSTFVNAAVGDKVSIVSSKQQTTRQQIKGILVYENSQIIFTDTPGFFNPHTLLEKSLIANFKNSYKDADVVLVMFDVSKKNINNTINFVNNIKTEDWQKIAIVLNKTDKIKKQHLLDIANHFSKCPNIDQIFMISAKYHDGINDVVQYLATNMPNADFIYEHNQTTDQEIKFRLAEITREKLYNALFAELPYNIFVETEHIVETSTKATIFQTITVTKDSQKSIVIGANGHMLQHIKNQAYQDMKKILHKNITIKLFVKCRPIDKCVK